MKVYPLVVSLQVPKLKKTYADKQKYGGIVNVAYDPCYHQACDTTNNIDEDVYLEMAQAATHALQVLFDQDNLHNYLWPHKNLVEKQDIQSQVSEIQPMTPLVQANHPGAISL